MVWLIAAGMSGGSSVPELHDPEAKPTATNTTDNAKSGILLIANLHALAVHANPTSEDLPRPTESHPPLEPSSRMSCNMLALQIVHGCCDDLLTGVVRPTPRMDRPLSARLRSIASRLAASIAVARLVRDERPVNHEASSRERVHAVCTRIEVRGAGV